MAGMIGGSTMLHLRRWVVTLGIGLLGPAALAQAPNPQIAAAQAVFESLPEAERKAIQTDLIWVGLLNSAASGGYGPLTFRAINQAKGGGPANGLLSATERQSLAQAARAVRDSVGFKLVTDERTGVRIGVPERILPKRETTPAGGSRWQSADGRITLDVSATPAAEPLEAIFQKATAANPNNPGRKITYKLLRPDFFVVSGETPTGKFYRRLAVGPQGLRGFSIGYDKALSDSVDRLVIALASSFEPFPSGPAPSAGSALASVTQPFVAPPQRPTERHGVALALTESVFVTSAAAIEGCRALRIASGPARLRLKDEASALALLDGAGGRPVAGLRAEALAANEPVLLLAFGEEAGRRSAQAVPGIAATLGDKRAVLGPLQPGQAGAPAFDLRGQLVGIVTGNPSDRQLVAGVAPQRAYATADAAALQGLLGRAGLALPAAAPGAPLSTGALVEKLGGAVLPLTCQL